MPTLAPDLQRLWTEYLAAEADRVRPATMPALGRFIDGLLARPRDGWTRWAKGTAAAVADHGADVSVRFPLFRRVLLPALADGVLRQEPGCARWLAHFEPLLVQLLVGTTDCDLPDHLRTAPGLLREAVRVDPGDGAARRRLVRHLANYHEYTLHELPAGVLYGRDGATPGECDELLAGLAEFREHLGLTGQAVEYDRLVRDCDFHYRTYRASLAAGRPGGSYEQYLSAEAPTAES